MKQAKVEVFNRVINYLKENLGNKCDLNNVEVYMGGDPSVGDGHLYLVIAKDKKSRSNKGDTYSCWTCWNDKTESLNYGHYDLSKENAMYILMEHDPVLEGEEAFIVEDINEEEEPRIFANEGQLHKFAKIMLKNYFETESDYGDTVESLMKYVPISKSKEILEDYNYEVKKGTKEQYQEILKDFNNIERDF